MKKLVAVVVVGLLGLSGCKGDESSSTENPSSSSDEQTVEYKKAQANRPPLDSF